MFRDYSMLWHQRREGLRAHKPSYMAREACSLDVHLLPAFGEWEMERWGALKPAEIQGLLADFISSQIGKGLAPRTARNCLSTLSQILDAAVLDGILKINPLSGRLRQFSLDRPPPERAEGVEPFRDDELHRFLGRAFARTKRDKRALPAAQLFLLLSHSGLRVNEALALEVADLDVQKRRVSVTKSLWVPETGIKDAHPLQPKTRHANRTVGITGQAAGQFEGRAGRLLFPADDGGYRSYSGIRGIFIRTLAEAGCRESLTIHCLRHTYATRRLNAGHPIFDVSRALGHSDVSTTARIYARWAGDHDPARLSDLEDPGLEIVLDKNRGPCFNGGTLTDSEGPAPNPSCP